MRRGVCLRLPVMAVWYVVILAFAAVSFLPAAVFRPCAFHSARSLPAALRASALARVLLLYPIVFRFRFLRGSSFIFQTFPYCLPFAASGL